MPSNKRQKELARRRAERQMARRQQERTRRRKRRIVAVLTIVGVVAAVAGIVGIAAAIKGGDKKKSSAKVEAACGAKKPSQPEIKSYGPKEPAMTIDAKKKHTMTLKTSCGDIVIALDAQKAPHTVNSLAFLAGKDFYDGSPCHRMNDAPTFAFLQCGDPSGTGSGEAPGYTLPEENTKGAKYTRGTMAMANTGRPHSTGSQFFLLDQDASVLPPNYSLVGHITSGIEVLDKIIALGTDKAFEPNPGGGHPNEPVFLDDVTVTEE